MKDAEFDTRLDRVKRASDVVKHLPSEALQAEAFRYLLGNGVSAPAAVDTVAHDAAAGIDESQQDDSAANGDGSKKTARRRAKPASVNPDKNLVLAPPGKQTWSAFAAEKQPTTHLERYTAAVYWLLEVAENEKATINQIVTCYHAERWNLPTDVKNQASQAGLKHLDSSSLNDLRLSTLGRNLVNDLPKTTKK